MAQTQIAAAASTHADAGTAAALAAAEVRRRLEGAQPDLAFLFLSRHHAGDAATAVHALRDVLVPRHLVGCVAGGVVAGARELEDEPGVAVWAASLPDAELEPFAASVVEVGDGLAVAGVPELRGASLVALLVDPYTFPVDALLDGIAEEQLSVPIVGGVAVGGGSPGSAALVLDDEVLDGGAVGVVVRGTPVVAVVSQGCAPVGRELVVTAAEDNVVHELAGRPALQVLREQLSRGGERERQLAQAGLLAGLVIDENKPDYGRGDFLMRGLLAADETTGALVLGSAVRVGQTLRFHARDAESARDDLERALAEARSIGDPAGALLFTCNGRGVGMFGRPDHDAELAVAGLGSDAVAGFFCGGEIGPVGSRSFLHGFTATLAVFLR